MTEPRDSQRSAVYAWEQSVIKEFELDKKLSLSECQDLINKIWHKKGKGKPPNVRDGRRRRVACYEDFSHVVKLPLWARQPIVVIHETVHGLLRHKKIPAHGRVFVTIMFDLWCQELKLPMAELRRMAIQQRPRRVRFAPRKTAYQYL